jgi:hypothetical protein
MAAVNAAYEQQDIQALYDLAGELDPAQLVELQGIEALEIRRLREQIMKVGRLRRKAFQRALAEKSPPAVPADTPSNTSPSATPLQPTETPA